VSGKGGVAEVLRVFLRLGLTSFGGPAAHVATMREEVVRRRAWLTDAAFLDLVGVASAIPGPTSTEIALHVGHRRAGWPGFAAAGAGFVLPAVALVLVAAWAYVAFGSRPEAAAVLAGMAPVVVAIVGNAAEHYSAVTAARQNEMTLALEISVGSSAQIALMVAPALVLLSYAFGTPMSLVFDAFEITAIGLSVLAIALVSLDGESNWLEGLQLLGIYVVLALAFYIVPG